MLEFSQILAWHIPLYSFLSFKQFIKLPYPAQMLGFSLFSNSKDCHHQGTPAKLHKPLLPYIGQG